MTQHGCFMCYRRSECGFALISALLILILLSALGVALLYKVNYEQKVQATSTQNNVAYYGAEAAMEKMMADLDNLYASEASPGWCDITKVTNSQPSISDIDVKYSEYQITIPNAPTDCSVPPSHAQTISQGPNAGLFAQIVPLTLRVTADRPSGEEVRMIRQVEIAEIPVFQFGVFSQSDLSFFPGPAFDFNGRVHTNGNLFLASAASVTFHASIRAAGDVVRDQLANGASTIAQNRLGTILIPTTAAGCDGTKPACRNLQIQPTNEGSSVGGPTPTYGGTGKVNPGWTTLSNSTYNGLILSGSTGAKQLSMAFVQNGVDPIEIIRRPRAGESLLSALGESRLFNQAQIRVLISDDPAELPGGANDGQNIRLANVQTNANAPDYSQGVPVSGVTGTINAAGVASGRVFFGEGTTGAAGTEKNWKLPQQEPSLVPAGAPLLSGTTWTLLDGYIRVEYRRSDGTYAPVTQEWLELGFARGITIPKPASHNAVNPNAILIFQQQADRNANGIADPAVAATKTTPGSPAELVTDGATLDTYSGAGTRNNWYPINFYETREGELRENKRATPSCFVGGVVNAVEVDVDNLRKWLVNSASGKNVEYTSQNGYILYVSDRRGMLANASGVKTGEYGYEDVINPATAAGTPNGVLDSGEDANGNGKLDTFGAADLGLAYPAGSSGDPTKAVTCMTQARPNWVSGARHVVRLVDGGQGQLPLRPDNNAGGFTLASENAAYIYGDYNAAGAFGDPHVSAAVIADTVTLLSNSWTDLETFQSPADASGRNATTTWYRVAIASGKNINFPHPAFAGVPDDFGTDGGVHNFLRFLENWGAATNNYLGSMASLYYSQYANGVFKCCGTVYSPPTRVYAFDTDFLDISKMPPGTPRFRDVVSLGFQQVF